MPPSALQRKDVLQFTQITGANERVAQTYLKRSGYKVDLAIDAYFQANPGVPIALVSAADANLVKLFEKYRNDKNDEKDTVSMDGIMSYLVHLDATPDDISCLIVLEAAQATALGELTKEEFVKGWKDVSSGSNFLDTIEKQRTYVASQMAIIATDMALFKRVYRHTFFSMKDRNQRAMSLESALATWELLFKAPGVNWVTPTNNWLNIWLEFLKEKWTKSVNKDMWNETFRFFQMSVADETLSFWTEDSAWPSVIDDFVAYVKEQRAATGDKMETD